MDLVPCIHCRRHVGVFETTCPFCARSAPEQRPQLAFAGRLTRAAIFSAAVVACDSKPAAPTPAPIPAQSDGAIDDDLEKMLDVDRNTADRPAPPVTDAGLPDATVAVAAPDAGISDEQRKADEQAKRLRKQKALEHQKELERQRIRIQVNNKPYGAPPARRRVV